MDYGGIESDINNFWGRFNVVREVIQAYSEFKILGRDSELHI